jgi:hypothetical protein
VTRGLRQLWTTLLNFGDHSRGIVGNGAKVPAWYPVLYKSLIPDTSRFHGQRTLTDSFRTWLEDYLSSTILPSSFRSTRPWSAQRLFDPFSHRDRAVLLAASGIPPLTLRSRRRSRGLGRKWDIGLTYLYPTRVDCGICPTGRANAQDGAEGSNFPLCRDNGKCIFALIHDAFTRLLSSEISNRLISFHRPTHHSSSLHLHLPTSLRVRPCRYPQAG